MLSNMTVIKVSSILLVGTLLTIALQQFKLIKREATIQLLERDIITLQGNLDTANYAIGQQDITIGSLQQLSELTGKRNTSLFSRYDNILEKSNGYRDTIEQLRISELQSSIESPYERGIASSERLSSILFRIAGTTDTSESDSNVTDSEVSTTTNAP